MNYWKTSLVLLLSFMLISVQGVYGSTIAAGVVSFEKAATCQCCGCGENSCCIQQSSSAESASLACVPGAQAQVQHIIASVSRLLERSPHDARRNNSSTTSLSLVTAPAVPLFKQNCTFLI